MTVSEGEAAELALTLSVPSGRRAVTVTWSTADGTAVSGADYVAVSFGEAMFAPGETAHTVVVSTVDDAAREGEESFVVRAQRQRMRARSRRRRSRRRWSSPRTVTRCSRKAA